MKDNRPVNLDIRTIQLPLAAITSILHRISGIIIFVGLGILLWIFDLSLASEASFNTLKDYSQGGFFKFIVWGTLSALAYHLVAGVKHLVMELGVGETKAGAPIGATITIIVSVILIVSLGVWIW